jgi:4-hydroxybutyrate CoA-transferase
VVNEPNIIMQNANMISINSCIQVDLTGQVNSESIGDLQISGIGGQMNFVAGAVSAEAGKSIIAMTSTTADGKHSKIVPVLDPGSIVTTLRTNVDYIITEYGIARLIGNSTRNRARSLIAIAHPDFRPALIQKYVEKYREPFRMPERP